MLTTTTTIGTTGTHGDGTATAEDISSEACTHTVGMEHTSVQDISMSTDAEDTSTDLAETTVETMDMPTTETAVDVAVAMRRAMEATDQAMEMVT